MNSSRPIPKPAEEKLLDVVREAIRLKPYSMRTEEAYLHWIRRFILFHGKRHHASGLAVRSPLDGP